MTITKNAMLAVGAVIATLMLVLTVVFLPLNSAGATGGGNPEQVCTQSGSGWGPKIDTTGDPATVTVTADPGFLITAYCVSGGPDVRNYVVDVNPDAAVVTITTGTKHAVSHYQVQQVAVVTPPPPPPPPTDVCPNIPDAQTEVPGGMVIVDGQCVTPTTPETPPVTPETPTETPTVTVPTETPTTNVPTPTEAPTPADECEGMAGSETVDLCLHETPEPNPESPDKDEPVKNGPKSTPQPPKDVQVIACVDGVWTTQVNGVTVSESGSCEQTATNSEYQTFTETGF